MHRAALTLQDAPLIIPLVYIAAKDATVLPKH